MQSPELQQARCWADSRGKEGSRGTAGRAGGENSGSLGRGWGAQPPPPPSGWWGLRPTPGRCRLGALKGVAVWVEGIFQNVWLSQFLAFYLQDP